MLDKVTTVPWPKLAECIGRVSGTDLIALSRGLVIFLVLA
jgi:mRNA-degrading endonuclease toxin of MazEF toxin-antitoxin module